MEFILKNILLGAAILFAAVNLARGATCEITDKECLENMMVAGFLKEMAESPFPQITAGGRGSEGTITAIKRKKQKGEKTIEFYYGSGGREFSSILSQEIVVKEECDLKCANSLFADWIMRHSDGRVGWRWK